MLKLNSKFFRDVLVNESAHPVVERFVKTCEKGAFNELHSPVEYWLAWRGVEGLNEKVVNYGIGWDAADGMKEFMDKAGITVESVIRDGEVVGTKVRWENGLRELLQHWMLELWLQGRHGSRIFNVNAGLEERSWTWQVSRNCKTHRYDGLHGISCECVNLVEMSSKKWVMADVGTRRSQGGDMAGGVTQRQLLCTGVADAVTYTKCGVEDPGFVIVNAACEAGIIDWNHWHSLLNLQVMESTKRYANFTHREWVKAFTGGKRKMGVRIQREWKPEDLLTENGSRDSRLVRELKLGKGTHDESEKAKRAVGTYQSQGRLRSKSQKLRANVDGKLKGVRVNGSRTESPVDYSMEGWFEVEVNGVVKPEPHTIKDVLAELLSAGEIVAWKETGAEAIALLIEEYKALFTATGDIGLVQARLKEVERMIIRDVFTPKDVLLILALAMKAREVANRMLRERKVKAKTKPLRLDLMGGDGTVVIGLWKQREFKEPTDSKGVLGDELWKKLCEEVERLREQEAAELEEAKRQAAKFQKEWRAANA